MEDGSIIEMRIWRVPSPIPRPFELLPVLRAARPLVVLFDNERGKGDRSHIGDVERAYRLETPRS